MVNYEWRIVEWTRTDDQTLEQVVNQETDTNWDLYATEQIHEGRITLFLRRQSGP